MTDNVDILLDLLIENIVNKNLSWEYVCYGNDEETFALTINTDATNKVRVILERYNMGDITLYINSINVASTCDGEYEEKLIKLFNHAYENNFDLSDVEMSADEFENFVKSIVDMLRK